MNTPNNQRARQTQKELEEALTLLLKKKNFDEISIQELCNRAGINRTTFYAHYNNMYDMIRTIQRERFMDAINFFLDQDTGRFHALGDEAYQKAIEVLKEVAANREISMAFFTSPRLYSQYSESANQYWTHISEETKKLWHFKTDSEALYHLTGMHATFMAIVQRWLQTGCQESAEDIVRIIYDALGGKDAVSTAVHSAVSAPKTEPQPGAE